MSIGTSDGAFYDDAHHQASAAWDPKYDNNVIDPVTTPDLDDGDNIETPPPYEQPHPLQTPVSDAEDRRGQSFMDMMKGYVGDQFTMDKLHAVMNHPFASYSKSVVLDTPDPPAATSQLAKDAGINNIDDPNNMTDQFNTILTPDELASYNKKFKPGDSYDYDMQGWFKANPDADPNGEGVHYPDTYKKPNHPTFSDQSQYSTPDTPGGHWEQLGDKSYTFTPSSTNLERHSPEELKDYFSRVEPTNKLILDK